ncbi:hypothetical protein [Salinimicrobium oceani]|uniref:Lipoprotein n=1 Tax=Salinimicrobium oceani TaxID=2722702 RepID=A0ABX1CVA0_9FLAO|nr:hypothetical protein [Salinimicrobium oceani]NJW52221.1 hypothetical protein [Salinimicrobium oceani]
MVKIKFCVFLIICLFTSCKTVKNAPDPYKSDLYLSENLTDFTSRMTDKDTVLIFAELNMEWWIRRDEIKVTKKDDQIRLDTTIKEDSTFEMKYEMRTKKLPQTVIQNVEEFENHFENKIARTRDTSVRQYIYKIISPNDTLTFYTNGLSDKGRAVNEYYKFMKQYYPEEKEFEFPEMEFEEVEGFTF